MSQQQEKTVETDELLIEFVFEPVPRVKIPRIFLYPPTHPVRGKRFRYGLKIKNIAHRPFPGGTLKNFLIKDFVTNRFAHQSLQQVAIHTLNPNDSKTYWIATAELSFVGAAALACDIQPSGDARNILVFKAAADGRPEAQTHNHWDHDIYVEDKLAVLQSRTNYLLLVLTLLIFVDGVWGLDEFMRLIFLYPLKWIVKLLGTLLEHA